MRVKISILPALLIVCLALAGVSAAERLYTWKDAQGVTHITQTPPPDNERVRDIIKYKPRTDAEMKAIEEEKKAFRQQQDKKAAIQEAMNARRKAQEAQEQATEAEAEAQNAQEIADEFKTKASTNWRRYHRNKATMLRLEAEAEAARQRALKAKESAQSTADTAADVEKRITAPGNKGSATTAKDTNSR